MNWDETDFENHLRDEHHFGVGGMLTRPCIAAGFMGTAQYAG